MHVLARTLPAPLADLFKPCYSGKQPEDLTMESERVFSSISITSEEAENLTLSTHQQTKSSSIERVE